jgi:hypothetical protein
MSRENWTMIRLQNVEGAISGQARSDPNGKADDWCDRPKSIIAYEIGKEGRSAVYLNTGDILLNSPLLL